MRRDPWVNVEECYRVFKPTEDIATELADRRPGRQVTVFVPPPDRVWVPQLLGEGMSLARIAKTTGLTVYKVKQILVEASLMEKPVAKEKPAASGAGARRRPKPHERPRSHRPEFYGITPRSPVNVIPTYLPMYKR